MTISTIMQSLLVAIGSVVPAGGGGSGYSGTTLNALTKGANVSLSNGNLTLTSASTEEGSAVSTTSQSSGKWYFEITCTTVVGGGQSVAGGVANSSFVTSGCAGRDVNHSVGFDDSGGSVLENTASIGAFITGISSGDVIGIAVDVGNQKIWMIDLTASGHWNGNAAYAPGDAHGFDISATASPYYAVVSSYYGPVSLTINFGDTAFTGSVPAGFHAWDSSN